MVSMRQGDVLLSSVHPLRAVVLWPNQKQDHLTLAEGEVTGHSHRIAKGNAVLYRTRDGMILKVYSETALLVHEEHQALQIPQGNWRITIQREYQPGGFRYVSD